MYICLVILQTAKCQLAYPNLRNIVAHGTVYYSSEKQTIHGVPLNDDCYRVSIDVAKKPASFLPIQAGEHKTVEDAINGFVAWPKILVIPDLKVSLLYNFLYSLSFLLIYDLPIINHKNVWVEERKR